MGFLLVHKNTLNSLYSSWKHFVRCSIYCRLWNTKI